MVAWLPSLNNDRISCAGKQLKLNAAEIAEKLNASQTE